MSEKHLMANVRHGPELRRELEIVSGLPERDFLPRLRRFLLDPEERRVGVVQGLRRTGKTVAMFHLMSSLPPEELDRTAYVVGRKSDTMATVHGIMENLEKSGFRWVFFDEVTKVDGFIDNSSVFSDIFTEIGGMRVVLSGTDSLSLHFSEADELMGKCEIFRTTHIPFSEYNRLKGSDIGEYVESGGILSGDAGERSALFKGPYALQAICFNIQRSLEAYRDGGFFMHLSRLHREGVLTGAINKVVQSATHAFLANFLNDPFKSRDIGSAADLLRKERNPEKRILVLDAIKEALTKNLARRLHIVDGIPVTDDQAWQMGEYLKRLDLVVPKPMRFCDRVMEDGGENMVVQPGLRWAHAIALVGEVLEFPTIGRLPANDVDVVVDKIRQDIKGNMLEEIVILDTMRNLSKIPSNVFSGGRFQVFKQKLPDGEIDMVVRDRDTDACALYEIKHSGTICGEQGRHLRDEGKLSAISGHCGRIVQRRVLTRAEGEDEIEDVEYGNVEDFLKNPEGIRETFDMAADVPAPGA